MKGKFFAAVVFPLLAVFFFAACAGAPVALVERSGPANHTFSTSDEYRALVDIPGRENIKARTNGVFRRGNVISLTSYKIGKYEVTWELWNEVITWAVENGYVFNENAGYQGHEPAGANPGKGTSETALGWTAEQKIHRPVGNVTFNEVVVWCNAYSELSDLEPVYASRDVVCRSAKDKAALRKVEMDMAKNGYRLPTLAEWEFAAHGADPDAEAWEFKFPGSNDIKEVAWTGEESWDYNKNPKDYGLHPVGMKKPNSIGLYDMAGGVWDYVWDWNGGLEAQGALKDPTGPSKGEGRVIKGGSFVDSPVENENIYRIADNYQAYLGQDNCWINEGFRVTRR
jgi:formylglycine-generating enzyme required for sulfatase activity